MAVMTPRERVARTLAHQTPDRVPMYDQFWMETEHAYRAALGCPLPPRKGKADWEGMSAAAASTKSRWELFDFDIIEVGWPDYRLRLEPPVVLEETDEWMLQRDGHGATLRWWKHRMGAPEHVAFEVTTPEKWRQVKHLLTPARERVRWEEFEPLYARARRDERFICYGATEIIEAVKDVLGHEAMLRAMIKQPEWVHDVFDAYCRLQIEMFRLVEAAGLKCDGAFIYGDIAYKNGPFMSPRHYREFVLPYHKRFFDEFRRRGMPILFHTDGDVRPLIPGFLEAGITCLSPLEAKAAMDVRALAPQYGEQLCFCGNIDVQVLETNDRERISAELESKLAAVMPYRGYVYHSDHSIPPGITLSTYQWVLSEVRRLGTYE